MAATVDSFYPLRIARSQTFKLLRQFQRQFADRSL